MEPSRDGQPPIKKCCHSHQQTTPIKAPPGSIYTCPMHPEIQQSTPGSCPICGMALEPLTLSLEPQENIEYQDMKKRFLIALIGTIPVFIVAMSEHFISWKLSPTISAWLQAILTSIVVLYCGWPFFFVAGNHLKQAISICLALLASALEQPGYIAWQPLLFQTGSL